MDEAGRSHRPEGWPWARDSISQTMPVTISAQNAKRMNGSRDEPFVLARQRDDQVALLIRRPSRPIACLARVALMGWVGFRRTLATILVTLFWVLTPAYLTKHQRGR